MSHTITNQCIACHRCQIICPTDAIQIQNSVLLIDPTTCNDCLGYYGTPQCVAACPTNSDGLPSHLTLGVAKKTITDYWDSWFNRYHTRLAQLKRKKNTAYWEQWFDVYSREIASLNSRQPLAAMS